jgi:uncharacterized protein (AIM24 family)
MSLDHDLVGNAMQMAVCRLSAGQEVYCEAGKFLFKTSDVTTETRLTKPKNGAAAPTGKMQQLLTGAMEAGKRVLAGESLALQYFKSTGGAGVVAFAGVLPGEMRALELSPGTTWMAERDAFVAAETTVDLDIAFSGLGTGLFGGEGFVLEKFTGTGTVLIAGAGNFIDLDLSDFGGRLEVDTGCVVAFEDSVKYRVERAGGLNRQGLMNGLFGGEGLALAVLEGHGKVILQSMTIKGLAQALAKNEHGGPRENSSVGSMVGLGATGGLGALGGLFGSRD